MGIYFEGRKLKIAKPSKLSITIQRFKTLSHISIEMLTSARQKLRGSSTFVICACLINLIVPNLFSYWRSQRVKTLLFRLLTS